MSILTAKRCSNREPVLYSLTNRIQNSNKKIEYRINNCLEQNCKTAKY
uniref:Uncharacterized protein n=1 Tax=Arundo donax TaxID=35708 RepID=A0A0A8Y5B9_ARUDO